MGDLGKLIVVIGFEKLPKVQLIAQSGPTGPHQLLSQTMPHFMTPVKLTVVAKGERNKTQNFKFSKTSN